MISGGGVLSIPSRTAVSEATQAAMDGAVHDIIASALQRATELLTQHRAALERCATELLAQETLDAPALHKLMANAA